MSDKLVMKVNERLVNILIGLAGVVMVFIGIILSFNDNETGSNGIGANILYGVGCSLIASAVVSFITSLYLQKKQEDSLVTDTWGLRSIHRTRQEMNIPCDADVKSMSKQLDMIGFGFRSFRDSQNDTIRDKVQRGVKIRIITIDPSSKFLAQRELDEKEQPGSIRNTILQLAEWVDKLKQIAPNPDNIQIKYYDSLIQDLYFRVDDHVYIGPYLYGIQSQQTISYRFAGSSEGFTYYTNYFKRLWEDSSYTYDKPKLFPEE